MKEEVQTFHITCDRCGDGRNYETTHGEDDVPWNWLGSNDHDQPGQDLCPKCRDL